MSPLKVISIYIAMLSFIPTFRFHATKVYQNKKDTPLQMAIKDVTLFHISWHFLLFHAVTSPLKGIPFQLSTVQH